MATAAKSTPAKDGAGGKTDGIEGDAPYITKLSRFNSALDFNLVNTLDQMFHIMAKERKICQLDCVTLIRAIGMNPTDADLRPFFERLNIRDAIRESEERRMRDEQKRKELMEAQASAAASMKRDTVKALKDRKATAKEQQYVWVPPERRPVVTWPMFINALWPEYRDSSVCSREIREAWDVFAPSDDPTKMMTADFVRLLTAHGPAPLTPAEVRAVLELFPGTVTLDALVGKAAGGPTVRPSTGKARSDKSGSRPGSRATSRTGRSEAK